MHAEHWDSHVEAAFWEDFNFLREGGLSDELIAQRLDIPLTTIRRRLSAVQKRRERERKRQAG